MNNITFSPIESRRFNRTIHRGEMSTINLGYLRSYISSHDPDVLIVRFPASEQMLLFRLSELDRDVIFADTLVYYESSCLDYVRKDFGNIDLEMSIANIDDAEWLQTQIPLIFENYRNHYSSNPALDKNKLPEAYIEWALSYLNAKGKICFLGRKSGTCIGFITCRYEKDAAEIILNGILPEYRKSGIYSDMIRYVKDYFFGRGIKSISISTQAQNISVQRIWIREGFLIMNAFLTVHLNKCR